MMNATSRSDASRMSVLLGFFERMTLIRRVEERLAQLFSDGKIPGFVHLSIGQEAVPVGVCSVLSPADTVSSTHRGHGHALAKGVLLPGFFAEIMGRRDGICAGRAGSMHVASMAVGMLGANGIVGGGLPIALGSALAHQVKGTSDVAVAFFGDGAMSEGAFHECINLAALWKLPLVFVCENNGWSEFSPTVEQFRGTLQLIASAFDIAYCEVDGSDVEAVAAAARNAVAAIRSATGPQLIECKTWRWQGHYAGDPQRYRSKDDQNDARCHDPIGVASVRLESAGVTGVRLQEIEAKVSQRVEVAMVEALASGEPDFGLARADVYAAFEGAAHV